MEYEPEGGIVFPMGYEPEMRFLDRSSQHGERYERCETHHLEQLRGFLAGAVDLGLTATADAAARYGYIKSVLKRFKYPLQSKVHRGLIRRYLRRVTGYSPDTACRPVDPPYAAGT